MYIVGDVHGCYKTLLALINKLPKDAHICFVGDLIDRGPASAEVVELVRSKGYDCVLGNHERMMIDYVPPGPYAEDAIWLRNGGNTTLSSYTDTDLYKEHLEWMESLPVLKEYPELKLGDRHLVVSHSSCANFVAGKASEYDVLWNRDIGRGTLRSANTMFNVFGHSVTATPVVTDFFANVDTGCVYNNHKDCGMLTAIHFPSLEVVQQENIEELQ